MRSLERNKQKIYYSLFNQSVPIRDEWGNVTGETQLVYEDPVAYHINVSPARGTADVEQFGINLNYTKTMVTNDLSCPIDETTRLWVGKAPVIIEDEVEIPQPHNYVVVAVARSINSVTYAIREVTVT